MGTGKDRLIFALDVPDSETARKYVHLLKGEVGLFKVGWELFLAGGAGLLEELTQQPGLGPSRLFLDLKFHDIPNTILGALRHLTQGIALITIHSGLGPKGLGQVLPALAKDVRVLAVTVLTSLTKEDLLALGYDPKFAADPAALVVRQARLAQEAGCHGVICSGREVRAVKEACGKDLLAVCPGIRPAWAAVSGDDQQRIVTPYEAIKNGADYIVVGRPIRTAPDPAAAARRVVQEIADALK